MKKALVATILGLATVVSTFAQGRVLLDTYATSPYPLISYGAANGNGSSGGTPGVGVNSTFNIGIYWVAGSVAGSVAADPTGYATPGSLLASFTQGLGAGSQVVATAGAGPGFFTSTTDFTLTPLASGPATLMIVAFNASTYGAATVRGHSAAFVMTPAQLGAATGVGAFMSSFQVFNAVAVPEPSTFALAGLGLAGLLIFRRRN